jgi:hypothetical protein
MFTNLQSEHTSAEHKIVAKWSACNILNYERDATGKQPLSRRLDEVGMIDPVITLAAPIGRFPSVLLAWRTGPNEVKSIQRIGQRITLNELKRVIALFVDIYADNSGFGPRSMQAHRRPAPGAEKIENILRNFGQFSPPSASVDSALECGGFQAEPL